MLIDRRKTLMRVEISTLHMALITILRTDGFKGIAARF